MPNDYAEKASNSFKAARILFEAECYDSCVSRCYYAILRHMGIRPPKEGKYEHDWVQAAVAGQLVRRRKLSPRSIASFLPVVLKLREEADYDISSIGRERASRTLRKAKDFIAQSHKVLVKHG